MESLINYAVIYVVIAYLLLQKPLTNVYKNVGFTLLNIVFTFICFFYSPGNVAWIPFVKCFLAVFWSYAGLYYYNRCGDGKYAYLVAFLAPLVLLFLNKTLHFPAIIGFSYLTFRLSYVVYEMHTGKITLPSLCSYLGFAFFPLIFLIGPISPYHLYEHSLNHPDRAVTPLVRSLQRILVGIIKCFLFAELFKTMSFSVLWFDGYYHGINDFIIASISSVLYLYFNFSGACDIIIGAAGILNIHIKENFNSPYLARNIKEVWNRSHITLSHYFRDVFFMPGIHYLGHKTGVAYMHINVVVMTLLTFMLIGLWHGAGVNYIIWGLLNGIGMAIFYIYSLIWRKLPENIQSYSNTWIGSFISRFVTLAYFTFAFMFVENSWSNVKQIFALLRI